jgi:hypothetical protein
MGYPAYASLEMQDFSLGNSVEKRISASGYVVG